MNDKNEVASLNRKESKGWEQRLRMQEGEKAGLGGLEI